MYSHLSYAFQLSNVFCCFELGVFHLPPYTATVQGLEQPPGRGGAEEQELRRGRHQAHHQSS